MNRKENDFKQTLLLHNMKYPLMTSEDFIKLCHQSVFGAHEPVSFEEALKSLEDESAKASRLPKRTNEAIGEKYIRVYLRDQSKNFLSSLARAFAYTSTLPRGEKEELLLRLDKFLALCGKEIAIDPKEASVAIENYKSNGMGAVSHSAIYKANYHPHYRVLSKEAAFYLPLIKKLDGLRERNEAPFFVLIEGRCLGGKSALARMLGDIFGAALIHVDDFYKNYSEPKDVVAIDAKRIKRELLVPLSKGETCVYQRYDCKSGAFEEKLNFLPKKIVVVEGSFSGVEALWPFYDVRVFLTVNSAVQNLRLSERESPSMAKRFLEEFIPNEEIYFKREKNRHYDFVFDTSDLW